MSTSRTIVTAVCAFALLAVPAAASATPRDRDHDGMPTRWERSHHLNPNRNDAAKDPDRDGLRNLAEFRSHTDPRDADTDNDGVNDANEDADRDGVDNGNEDREGTNPRRGDSNGNGTRDGKEDRDRDHLANAAEDRTGNDPIDPDTDDDGIKDGAEQAGTIASFVSTPADPNTGVLTITLADGKTTITGNVTAKTEIKCESEGDHEDGHDGHGSRSHDGAGEDSGKTGTGSGQPGSNPAGSGQPGSNPADDDGPGHDKGDDDGDHGEHGNGDCTAADLKVGTPVHEAELELTSAGMMVFEEIELVKAPVALAPTAAGNG